eukprot:13424-Heterococcus_DN1.PRE.2
MPVVWPTVCATVHVAAMQCNELVSDSAVAVASHSEHACCQLLALSLSRAFAVLVTQQHEHLYCCSSRSSSANSSSSTDGSSGTALLIAVAVIAGVIVGAYRSAEESFEGAITATALPVLAKGLYRVLLVCATVVEGGPERWTNNLQEQQQQVRADCARLTSTDD